MSIVSLPSVQEIYVWGLHHQCHMVISVYLSAVPLLPCCCLNIPRLSHIHLAYTHTHTHTHTHTYMVTHYNMLHALYKKSLANKYLHTYQVISLSCWAEYLPIQGSVAIPGTWMRALWPEWPGHWPMRPYAHTSQQDWCPYSITHTHSAPSHGPPTLLHGIGLEGNTP